MFNDKPIAVFDIDGTIFRSSLLIELNEMLVRNGVFPESAAERVRKVRSAWLNRKGSYKEYIDTIVQLYIEDIEGKSVSDVRAACKELIAQQKDRVYVYTRDLIEDLRHTHVLVIISFSPMEVVQEFNKYYEFDVVSGISYEQQDGVFTGKLAKGTQLDKKKILGDLLDRFNLHLKYSIGVGDTETDAEFLKMVERPIAFNPNKKLFVLAKKHGWEILVERKDVIHRIV